ncbi:hypothetical protein JAAARDRAFT_399359 [Jaapia argillacea MUCL 33604]|uniref:Uncharacterized protein n=1 Tax=Jaapia argillacea MUCL 33604 TaxID=933084 RepID=A0A067PL86_9AGAM|nr:hypothetical protein JAAARDRAFT_399359 [Jaapia argillacea MUCL 33604]
MEKTSKLTSWRCRPLTFPSSPFKARISLLVKGVASGSEIAYSTRFVRNRALPIPRLPDELVVSIFVSSLTDAPARKLVVVREIRLPSLVPRLPERSFPPDFVAFDMEVSSSWSRSASGDQGFCLHISVKGMVGVTILSGTYLKI